MTVSGRLDADRFVPLVGEVPTEAWPHLDLWKRVRETLHLLPTDFDFGTELRNIPAADIPSANTLLGAGIEAHIPKALNRLKSFWDPDGQYAEYFFTRQPQVFPDVPLKSNRPDADEPVLFAVEVKGWYVLGREKEPSFRVKVNPHWCHSADLFVVYPWALEYAVAGKAHLFSPFVLGMREAARLRNEYWEKRADGDAAKALIIPPQGAPHYWPKKGEEYNDEAPADGKAGNFGRVARTGVMDEYIAKLFSEEQIAGISLSAWQKFLAAFENESSLDAAIRHIEELHLSENGGDQQLLPQIARIADAIARLQDRLATESQSSSGRRRRGRQTRE